jgi:tRNA-specific 2-thiouridylase
MPKVMAAMSGGVDSSVAAKLLLERGFDVTGVTLKLFSNDEIGIEDKAKTCCSLADVEDAKRVAYKLGIRHYILNLSEEFSEEVIRRFAQGYINGLTPNPCIDCNRYIKFNKLLQKSEALGFDCFATGHYARIEYDGISGRYLLKCAADRSKDQTYVLYAMTQQQLSKTLFPIGGYHKSQIREIAQREGLVNAQKPDSQDICFVREGDYASVIRRFIGEQIPEGDFVDVKWNVLGRHKGIINYTIGQRKGLGIPFERPMFVVSKDRSSNTVTLGEEQLLFSDTLTAGDCNLIAIERLTQPMKVKAKVRYSQSAEPATIYPCDEGKVSVVFERPVRAITPGQAVVFYEDDVVIGGATILGK